MPTAFLVSLAFSFVSMIAPDRLQLSSVADNYSLWLSDTSVDVQAEGGTVVSMQFPAARRTTSRDGRQLRYSNVFPNIDLVIYKNQDHFEYDWNLAPEADASAIRVSFRGARYERIDANGDLILGTANGEVRHGRPFAYQKVNGVRRPVTAAFDLASNGRVRFKLGDYDKSLALVIDPSLSFVSGIGGSGVSYTSVLPTTYTDVASSMAVDSSGNIYLSGLAYSPDFPQVNALRIAPAAPTLTEPPCAGAFAAKLSPDGKAILYSTLVTGCSSSAPSIAADSTGNVYIVGTVKQGDALVQVNSGTVSVPSTQAFLVKLDPNGVLGAAMPFGGTGTSAATSIFLGPDGKLYITGTTSSPDFPVTTGAIHANISSTQDLFLMKLDPAGLAGNQYPTKSVLYSTYLGAGDSPVVKVDAAGDAFVAANTTSTAWTTTPGAFQSECWDASREGGADVIVMKVNQSGSQFIYTTYLGGSQTDTLGGLAVDGSGDAYLSGTTGSLDFPTTPGAYAQHFDVTYTPSAQTGFVVKLSPDASQLTYSTLVSSEAWLTGTAIAIDGSGNAWVSGLAGADLLPVQNGIQQTLFTGVCYFYDTPDGTFPTDAGYCSGSTYLAELNPAGSKLLWATYLGGGASRSIVLDNTGSLFEAGNLAITNAAASPSKNNSATVVKINLSGTSLTNLKIESAAGFQTGLAAPGGLATLFIDAIPPTGTVIAPGLPLPTELAGIQVFVNGIAAPILAVAGINSAFVVQTQVNFQVPFEISSSQAQATIVEVQYAGQSAFAVPEQAGPGIFTLPNGAGVIQHAADYSLVTGNNPVHPGETVIIYASGLGSVTTPVATGTAASAADPVMDCNNISTNLGTVLYAGLTPDFPGLYQVNVQVSKDLPAGINNVSLETYACWPLFGAPHSVFQGNMVPILVL